MLARFEAGNPGLWRGVSESLPGQLARFPLAARYAEALELRPGSRLLQVGGGPELGRWLAGLAEVSRFASLHPSRTGQPEAVAWPGQLPVRDGAFSALLAPDLIRWLNDDELWPFLEEAARVTRPGARILLIDVPPVKSGVIERWHDRVVGGQRRGWASLLHRIAEMGAFSTAQLIDPGPSLWPPVPRIGILIVRRDGPW